jgi:nitrite reductase (NADH) small subunit
MAGIFSHLTLRPQMADGKLIKVAEWKGSEQCGGGESVVVEANCRFLASLGMTIHKEQGCILLVVMFTKLGSQSDLPGPNEVKEFLCDGKTFCVANVNGEISAMDNICLHRGGPLGQGVIEGGKVICPWHGWAWDPKTGEAQVAGARVAVYPVKIEGGDVLIDF